MASMVSQTMLESLLVEGGFSQGFEGGFSQVPEASSMRGEHAASHEEKAETANRERMDTSEDDKHYFLRATPLRALEGEVSMVEVCRHIGRALHWVLEVESRFDMSWLLKDVRDVCTLAVRILVRSYAPKHLEDFIRMAWIGMRFLCEEAVRRVMSVMAREKRGSYANLLRSVRNYEVVLLADEVRMYGLWQFSDKDLDRQERDFCEGTSHISRNAHYEEVRSTILAFEFLALRIPAQMAHVAVLSKHDEEMILEV